MRIDGKFVDTEGNQPQGQYVRFQLLRHELSTYAILAGPPIPFETMLRSHLSTTVVQRASIGGAHANSTRRFHVLTFVIDRLFVQANKLSTVKKCLNEVLKYGGNFSPRDLYPVRFLPNLSDRGISLPARLQSPRQQ